MICNKKHIEIPIPDSEWLCPKCGSKDIWAEPLEITECDLFHPDDTVCCPTCFYEVSLKSFINSSMKKKNMVKCECCKGTGWVAGK